jgi:hypothetical protein
MFASTGLILPNLNADFFYFLIGTTLTLSA